MTTEIKKSPTPEQWVRAAGRRFDGRTHNEFPEAQ